jgi:hypothetical protein
MKHFAFFVKRFFLLLAASRILFARLFRLACRRQTNFVCQQHKNEIMTHLVLRVKRFTLTCSRNYFILQDFSIRPAADQGAVFVSSEEMRLCRFSCATSIVFTLTSTCNPFILQDF